MDKWEEKYLKSKLKKHNIIFFNRELFKNDIKKIKDVEILVVFIYSELKEEILKELPKLKLIVTMSTGYDHIQLEYCKKGKIRVCNVPYYGENTVAEHTFGLILGLSKNLHKAIERTKEDNFSIQGLIGFDLKGKTLGVIGVGHIGEHVIRIANGFEMKVIAYTPHTDKRLEKKLNFRYVPLNYLLKNSNVISIHAPLNKSTYHMINMKNIRSIKKGAYLINTARGSIIDTTALLYGLDRGILAGAALDVLEGEEDIKEEKQKLRRELFSKGERRVLMENHKLLKEKNVIITPHSAFYTKEALQRVLDTSIGNINSYLKGKIINCVI